MRICLYQYLKLEKKIAAGANMAITQVGWDATKFVELKKYLDERGIKTPVLGNVYVLSRRPPSAWTPAIRRDAGRRRRARGGAAEGIGKRLMAGCRRASSARRDRSRSSRASATPAPTSAARTTPKHIAWMIRRAEELAPKWEELSEELQFGKKDGFYLYKRDPQPKPTRTFLPDGDGRRRQGAAVRAVVEETQGVAGDARVAQALSAGSIGIRAQSLRSSGSSTTSKKEVFGCQNCGNCVLGPWNTCVRRPVPKQMRNGPCGGTFHGACEVIDQECIWVKVMARAEASNTIDS